MRTSHWFLFFGVLPLLFGLHSMAASAANAADDCGGGRAFELLDDVDHQEDESGIGGTGASEVGRDPQPAGRPARGDDDESGVGGTGHGPGASDDHDSGIGGTGIFGRVTRTQGLCANGFEIVVPSNVALESGSGDAALTELSVGRLVWIEATRTQDRLVATRIVVYPAASRPTQALLEEAMRRARGLEYVSIEGVSGGTTARPTLGAVELDFGAAFPGTVPAGLRPGSRIRVGGQIDTAGRFVVRPPDRTEKPNREADPATGRRRHNKPTPAPAPERPDATAPERPIEDPRQSADRPRPDDRPPRPERIRPPTVERPVDVLRR